MHIILHTAPWLSGLYWDDFSFGVNIIDVDVSVINYGINVTPDKNSSRKKLAFIFL